MTLLTAQWLFPITGEPLHNAYLAIDSQGLIEEVGLIEQLSSSINMPSKGSILTPGLINVHTHLEQTALEPIQKQKSESFLDWLLKLVAFTSSHGSQDEHQERCRRGIELLLSTGTTCVNDIASNAESLKVLNDAGLRGIVSLECFHPSSRVEISRIEQIAQQYEDFSTPYSSHPLLKTGLSPHSPYNVSANAWSVLLERIKPSFVHTHIAEWLECENDYLQGKITDIQTLHQKLIGKAFEPGFTSKTSVLHLDKAGLLNFRMVLAHCLDMLEGDHQILAECSQILGIAHCPRSNMALHGQTLNWKEWEYVSIPVGLGTDGRLSTENLDLRAEARLAQALHGWSNKETLKKLTYDGAKVLGLEKEVGQLKSGYSADCVLWLADDTEPCQSVEHALDALLSERTKVQSVYVQGQLCWSADVQVDTSIKPDSEALSIV